MAASRPKLVAAPVSSQPAPVETDSRPDEQYATAAAVPAGAAVESASAPATQHETEQEPAPVPTGQGPESEPRRSYCLADMLPVAEMNVKGALAIWVILTFTMVGFTFVREALGVGTALALLAIVFGMYAASVAWLLFKSHKWISPATDDPLEQRILKSISNVANRSGVAAPAVALDADEVEINAYTYGLAPQAARVLVTKGFIDHVKPTDDELEAVLAHEMSHIRHGDFVISTLLRFPIWVMAKVQWMMGIARWIAGQLLSGLASCGCGIFGLVLAIALLIALLYLSIGMAIVGASIVVCVFFLNAFEREREYLADLYSATVLGTAAPMMRALANLEQATAHVNEVLEKRIAEAEEGQEVDLKVEARERYDSEGLIGQCLTKPPSFWESVMEREIFSTHPLAKNRIYYLQHPEKRKRFLTRIMEFFVRKAEGPFGQGPAGKPMDATALAVGGGIGLLASAISALSQHWAIDLIILAAMMAGGLALGWSARSRSRSGRAFVQDVALAGFVTATVLLVAGSIAGSAMATAYLAVFLFAELLYGAFGVLGAKLER